MKTLYLLSFCLILTVAYTSCKSNKNAYISTDTIVSESEDLRLKELIKKDSSTLLIDVRTSEEYKAGHIKGSRNIPLQDIENSNFELDKQAKIVLVCKTGRRAEKAKQLLSNQGYINVENAGNWKIFDDLLKSDKK